MSLLYFDQCLKIILAIVYNHKQNGFTFEYYIYNYFWPASSKTVLSFAITSRSQRSYKIWHTLEYWYCWLYSGWFKCKSIPKYTMIFQKWPLFNSSVSSWKYHRWMHELPIKQLKTLSFAAQYFSRWTMTVMRSVSWSVRLRICKNFIVFDLDRTITDTTYTKIQSNFSIVVVPIIRPKMWRFIVSFENWNWNYGQSSPKETRILKRKQKLKI